ncbi:hypothetical protein Tco_0683303 [Tanacetum coccineum]|uniref:Uncharacterized protein n=1 Tax=Tanacetum coccineum TaxID=301880 RepID=A0ABQ4XV12_9ASTR
MSYTSISSDSDPSSWGILLMDADELPEMDLYEELGPVYPEYLVPSDDDILVEDPEEEPEEDPIDYAADVDDDEDEEEDSSEDEDEEEEEHLALSDSNDVASPAVDLTPIPFPSEGEVARLLALPTPLPSSLTLVSSPLPQIPPLPTSPTYDQASLSLPRKRLILTDPTPRFEVGESSTAAAARQPRSTIAHRVDYSFLDTIDASIRASERRTMAVVEVVNLRERFEVRQALDRSEAQNRALEVRIVVLETQAYRHEWQHQDANDYATRAVMRIHVLEARAHIDTLEDTGSSA